MDKRVMSLAVIIIIVISAIGASVAFQSMNNTVTLPTPSPTEPPASSIITPVPSQSAPTPTPTPAASLTPSPMPTAQPTPTTQPTITPTITPSPSPTPDPIPTFQLQNVSSNVGTYNFTCAIEVNIDHLQTEFYNNYFFIAYRDSSDTTWSISSVNQNASGTTTFKTPYLLENTVYYFRVSLGQSGSWSNVQQVTTASNTIPYPVPSNVVAYSTLYGVGVDWEDLLAFGFRQINYIIYHNTVNDSSSAVKLTRVGNPYYYWSMSNVSDYSAYVSQYFWVASVSPSNIESEKSPVVSAVPIRPMEPTPLTAPKFSLVNQSNGDPVFFQTRIVVNITRMQDYFQNGKIVTISGYSVEYRQSSGGSWFRIGNIPQRDTSYIQQMTLPLEQNCTYDFRVCAVNGDGLEGVWSDIQQVTTLANTLTPPKVTGLVATSIVGGVLLEWDSAGLLPSDTFYRIYKNTTNDPITSVAVGEVKTAGFVWHAQSESDYVMQYFWVVIVNCGGVEGPK